MQWSIEETKGRFCISISCRATQLCMMNTPIQKLASRVEIESFQQYLCRTTTFYTNSLQYSHRFTETKAICDISNRSCNAESHLVDTKTRQKDGTQTQREQDAYGVAAIRRRFHHCRNPQSHLHREYRWHAGKR